MSVQAGICRLDGNPLDRVLFQNLNAGIESYGPDGGRSYVSDAIGMSYRACHLTKEARLECQPHRTVHGNVITWDGRLDNRDDLIRELRNDLVERTDLAIVIAGYEKWGIDCFCRFVGDWALSIWDPAEKKLLLSKDYIGIHHLYYRLTDKSVIWCTHLAPIVQLPGLSLTLNGEYVAGYLAMYPEEQLTPYREIQAVPPGSFVTIRSNHATTRAYWSLDTKKIIRYKADREYEEHFRDVFRQAVRRRLRSDSPILAQLSGGLDSSSIVCMADDILAKGEAETPRLDTISIYDPNTPEGDERRYFSKIEERRGKEGHHVERTNSGDFLDLDSGDLIAVPGSSGRATGLRAVVQEFIQSSGYRVVLSGSGGDEFLGGIQDPLPQLADLIVVPQPLKLARQLIAWSLVKKQPWIQLMLQTMCTFLPRSLQAQFVPQARIPSWIDPTFARRYGMALRQLGPDGTLGLSLPSRRANARTFVTMRRLLASCPRTSEERCYPYLDQTLIEFLLSIPATQLLRPGQRRSLMRRALVGLVPEEILFRRTKGTSTRNVVASFQRSWSVLEKLFGRPISAELGYINRTRVLDSLEAAKNGNAPLLIYVLKGILLELWLQSLVQHGLINSVATQTSAVSPAFMGVRV